MKRETPVTIVELAAEDIIDYKMTHGLQLSEAEAITEKERNKIEKSRFLFPKTRSYPITSPSSVMKAIHAFGRGKNGLSYPAFIKKLHEKCKELGPEYVAAIPDESLKKAGIVKDDKK